MTLTLVDANRIVGGAIAKARQLNAHISVAVCDSMGRLVALNRMDDAYETANESSIGKAIVSAGTGLPSGEVKGTVDHPSVATEVGTGAPATRIRGGLPILRGGVIEGGCGVNGAPSFEQDELCAHAGIAACEGQ